MKVYTCGDFNKPKLVIINPFMNDSDKTVKTIHKLSKDYYVVLPILSGFYPNSTFKSMAREELELSIFLKSHNLNKIDIMVGFSLGGNIAFDFYAKNSDIIDRLIIDSAPLYKYSWLKKKIKYYKYYKLIMDIVKNRDKEEEILLNVDSILLYIKEIIPLITDKSLRNIINTCFNINIYNLNKKEQEKITFVYGSKDKNKRIKRRIKKYKESYYIPIKNAGHCQYFMKKTNSYINKIIKDMIK